jgi:hypothetical protein
MERPPPRLRPGNQLDRPRFGVSERNEHLICGQEMRQTRDLAKQVSSTKSSPIRQTVRIPIMVERNSRDAEVGQVEQPRVPAGS